LADVKWIKIATGMFDNRKIKQIRKLPEGDAIIVIWLQIICLAGITNDSGLIYFSKDIPYTDEMLSVEFDRPINIIRIALTTFEQFGMVELIDNILMVSNWQKYQSTDRLEAIKEKDRQRKRIEREQQKQITTSISKEVPRNVHGLSKEVPSLDIDIEIDKDKDIKNKKNSRFTPPSLDEVNAYCKERNNNIDPEAFIAFYQSKDWKVGNQKMKDWKACVITWEKREKKQPDKPQQPKQSNNKFNQFPQRTYTENDYEELERKLLNKGL
jgi:predicted phage replisome organizer